MSDSTTQTPVSYPDFEKLDIRVGTVIKADVPEWSHWVMKLEVDFGELGIRKVFSGIMKFYKPDELVNKQFPFIVNLKPKRIGPPSESGEYEYSEAMMIMAVPVDDEETAPVLLAPIAKTVNGVKIR